MGISIDVAEKGASSLGFGGDPDDPMWVHTTNWVSSSAAQSGAHARSNSDGNPRGAVFSGKLTARAPRAAQRRTSAAHASGSRSGRMIIGI
jgi:hypothetical protein